MTRPSLNILDLTVLIKYSAPHKIEKLLIFNLESIDYIYILKAENDNN